MAEPGSASTGEVGGLRKSQKQLIGFIVVIAVTTVVYRLVYASGAQRTAALYVGVPTVLAIGLALLPRSKSATGMLVRGGTLATLIAAVILPEGAICLLFALPLVLLVAVLIGAPIDWSRRRGHPEKRTLMAVAIPLLVLSSEGAAGSPFDDRDAATATAVVAGSTTQVAAAIASPLDFDAPPPTFLRIGFNRPVAASGAGIDVGDKRTVDFAGGSHDEHPLRLLQQGDGHRETQLSQMHLMVVESAPGRVVFAVDQDTTMLSRWVDLDRAVVTWEPIDAGTTRVHWRLEYRRLIYPTAYFAPLQRFGMRQAAGYLLDAVVSKQLE